MKTAYVVTIILALFLVSACSQKVNNPADADAVKKLEAGYEKAVNSRDFDWMRSTYYTDDVAILPPNQMLVSGKEAIMALEQRDSDLYSSMQFNAPVEEVLSSGDLAVARGTFYWTATPKASGLGKITTEGKWLGTFARQSDGSWKCSQIIYNSDQPAPGTTADGKDEEALLQIERDSTNAVLNKDRAALDKILAKEYVGTGDDGIRNKRQLIAYLTGSALKYESAEINDMQPMVFGDTGIVHGMISVKGTERGKDITGRYRWTDIFQKRDGSWQCVASYGTAVQ